MKYLRRHNLNIGNILDDTVLQRADGNVELNPTQKVIINGDLEFGPGFDIPGPEVTNVIYVTLDGNDNNTGLGEGPGQAKRTLKSALSVAQQGTTIFVHSGEYVEDNPLVVPPKVSIIGDNLRRTIIRPLNGPQSVAVTTVVKTDKFVTITTATAHGLNVRERIRVKAQLGADVDVVDIVANNTYRILTLGNTDFLSLGADINSVGEIFTANEAVPAGTGTVAWIQVDEMDVNVYSVPAPNQLVFRQSGINIASTAATGKVLWAPDLFLVNSSDYLNGMVFKGLAAPAYCVNIDSDAIVDTSPYIQNCSNINGPWMRNGVEWLPFQTTQPDLTGTFVAGPRPLLDNEIDPTQLDQYGIDVEGAGGGMLIDGDRYSSDSPIKSMVGDAFTMVSQGGVGFHITNFGYMQLVSCFAVFCSKAFYTTRGGYLSISNSVIDFGTEGFVAEGFYPDPYGTGLITTDYYSSVASITVSSGAGYTSVPTVTIEPPTTPGGVQATATASIDPILGVVNAITIDDSGSGYDFVPNVVISGGNPSSPAFGIVNLQKNLFVDVFELPSKPQIGSVMFLGNDPQAYYVTELAQPDFDFKYDELRFRRDIGIILDAVLADMLFNSTHRSVYAGLTYLGSVTSLQKTQTIVGLQEAKFRAALLATSPTVISRIQEGFDTVINIINFGSSIAPAVVNTPPEISLSGYNEAVNILLANKQFIQDELIEWVANNTTLIYDETKCRRDVAYITDAMCYDLLYGGNTQSVNAALAYKEGSVIAGQVEETKASYTYWQSIVGNIVKNIVINTEVIGQNITLPLGSPVDPDGPANVLEDLLQILIDVLDHGPGYIPDPVTQPNYQNGNTLLLAIRNDILASTVEIQEQVVDKINNLYGGSARVFVFPPILTVLAGTDVLCHNVSTISTGGTALEYVGAGVTYNALPFYGGEPIRAKERVERDSGRCFTVSNDQIGNFKVGEFFTINSLTGEITIDAEKLNLNGLASIGPFRRSGVPVGVQLREVSNNANLVSSTGSPDVNTVPTQPAVRTYVENRYLNKVAVGPQTVQSDVAFIGDVEIRGADLTTDQTVFNLLNATATTVNAFGAATTVEIGAATGTLTINNNKVILDSTGSLQVPVGNVLQRGATANGQIRYNSELSIFEGYGPGGSWGSLGGVRSVDGLTQITAESAPAASDDILRFFAADVDNVTTKLVATLTNQSFVVLNDTQSTDKDTGAVIVDGGVGIKKNLNVGGNVEVNGDVNIDGSNLTVSLSSFNLLNTFATTLNFAGAATTINIGAAIGTTSVKHNLEVQGATFSATRTTFDLLNTATTTVNFAGETTTVNIGAATGTTSIKHNLEVQGSTFSTTQTTFNLLNTTAATVNFAGAGSAINIGSSSGNTNVRNSFNVDINSTLGLNTDSLNTINGKLTVNLKDNVADILTISEGGNNYIKINTNNSLELITFGVLPVYKFLNETDASSTSVASTSFAGGVGIAKKLFVGTDLDVDGSAAIGDATTDAHTIIGSLIVSAPDNTATALQIRENTQPYFTVVTTDGNESITFESIPRVLINNITQSTTKDTGAVVIEGGVGIEKNVNVGGTLGVTGNTILSADLTVNGILTVDLNATITGDLAVNGGDITTTSSTFNVGNTVVTTGNLFGVASVINAGINASTASVLTVGPAITGNTFKLSGTTTGIINYTTDVTSGTVNAWQSVTGTVNLGKSGTVNIGNSTVATTAAVVGGAITGNSLKIASTAGGSVVLNSDVITGTVDAFTNLTSGTINLGSVTSTVNIGVLALTTDLAVQYGGTGRSTFNTNGVIYGNSADGLLVTTASNPGSNATTSYGILTTDINNVPVWTDVIDGGSY